MKSTALAIIVPCFNEEDVLPLTHQRLYAFLGSLVRDGRVDHSSYILYVDDGSSDNTWQLVSAFCNEAHVRGIKLTRNVGQQHALMAGMEAARADVDALVTIDADLQDDVSAISEMLNHLDKGCDIVYGVRRDRSSDTLFKRWTARAFYRVMNYMGVQTVNNHADFRLMSRRAVDALCLYEERNLYLRGLVPLLGFKTATVHYDRQERPAGESAYPVGKMISLAIDGVTSFSVKPLRLIFYLGALFLLISIGILAYVIVALCQGHGVQGWASLMLSIWFVGGCLLICLSIIAAYIGRIYIEGKHRPLYHIDEYLK